MYIYVPWAPSHIYNDLYIFLWDSKGLKDPYPSFKNQKILDACIDEIS